jgi:hypothetical protein
MIMFVLFNNVWSVVGYDDSELYLERCFIGIYSTFENACIRALKLDYDGIWPPHISIKSVNIDSDIIVNSELDELNDRKYIVNKYEQCIFDITDKKSIVYCPKSKNENKQLILGKYLKILKYGDDIKKDIFSPKINENKILKKIKLDAYYHSRYDEFHEEYYGVCSYEKDDVKGRFSQPSFVFGRSLKELKTIKNMIEYVDKSDSEYESESESHSDS